MVLSGPSRGPYVCESSHELMTNMLGKMGLRRRTQLPPDPEGNSLVGKTAIVTGGNRGLGKDTVEGLAARGCRVILAARNLDLGKKAAEDIISRHPKAEIVVKQLDLVSFKSVRAFCQQINSSESKIDFLVHNAGLSTPEGEAIDPAEVDGNHGVETMVVVMLYSIVLMTILLYNKVKAAKDSRIIMVLSIFHFVTSSVSIEDLTWPPESNIPYMTQYGHIKLALQCFTAKLAEKALKDGIRVYSADPGVSRTDFSRGMRGFNKFLVTGPTSGLYMRPSSEGSHSILCSALIDDKTTYDPKKFYFRDGQARSIHPFVKNENEVEKVWQHIKTVVKDPFDM